MQAIKLIDLPLFTDVRGVFVKTFNDSFFQAMGINFCLKESYFSVSKKDVIRGMHFQVPPHQHAKIVFCPSGAILDVALDLRSGSPTYGKCFSNVLSAENHQAFFIPEGFAHGFKALTEGAITYYLVSGEYNQGTDAGIAYDSFAFDWECKDPVISERDRMFTSLDNFISPF